MDSARVASRACGWREEAGQFSFLTRHFFGRLFRNDIVDFEDQMTERLIATLAVLAIVVFWSSELLLFKYNFVPDVNLSWQEKTYVYALVMIIFGIVTLLEWDVLFPDRQDFLNLMPLPVRLLTLFLGKLASLILFIGLFSAAMNCGSAVLFSIYLNQWRAEGNLFFAARYAASHLAGALAACIFVFFACVFLQFLLMAVLPFRLYRRVSFLVRGGLLALFIFLLLAFFVEPAILDASFRSMARLKASGDHFLNRFPPLWFVGLYETFLGTRDPLFRSGARNAVWAVVFSLAAFAAAGALSYYRHVRKTLEASPRGTKPPCASEFLSVLFAKVTLRAPEERAVYGFFAKTMRANPKHRITMVYYLAIAAGILMLYVVPNREGFRTMTPANIMLLGQPLFLALVILAGLRTLVNVPASPPANWVFGVTETGRTERYAAGAKKAVYTRWLVPLVGLVLAFHLAIWSIVPALVDALFLLVICGLALEAFFYRFRKVPFACTHVPGKFKFHVWGIPAALAFFVFMSLATRLERALLERPARLGLFLAPAAGLWFLFRNGNRRFYGRAGLVFEEEPEPAMVSLPEG